MGLPDAVRWLHSVGWSLWAWPSVADGHVDSLADGTGTEAWGADSVVAGLTVPLSACVRPEVREHPLPGL